TLDHAAGYSQLSSAASDPGARFRHGEPRSVSLQGHRRFQIRFAGPRCRFQKSLRTHGAPRRDRSRADRIKMQSPALNFTPRGLYIGGRWVSPAEGKSFASINPSNMEKLADIPSAGEADVDAAVGAAKAGFKEWS